ncbi:hypothetical protein SDC9_124402 [bioreactor metagenome]|uniref:Helix-turn-helix domain-containing protein n=1 Tax=bioreactor metagenome TaxID=1076179 RepID=A0A645CKD8_9ZZZZ
MEGFNDILNGKEAALLLHSNYYTIMRKAKVGQIPSFKLGGKVLFRRSTIEGWIALKEKHSINEQN